MKRKIGGYTFSGIAREQGIAEARFVFGNKVHGFRHRQSQMRRLAKGRKSWFK